MTVIYKGRVHEVQGGPDVGPEKDGERDRQRNFRESTGTCMIPVLRSSVTVHAVDW